MTEQLKKHTFLGYTGNKDEGDDSHNLWPHPTNNKFNSLFRSIVNIYAIGRKEDKEHLLTCKEYIESRVSGLIEHKIKRDTEEHLQALNLSFSHGFRKDTKERHDLLEKASIILCAGDWAEDEDCLQQYRMATMLKKNIYEMYHEPNIPFSSIVRFLEPVRPITDDAWDPEKAEDILIYQNKDGVLELIDGNHRHDFAMRLGTVDSLSGWILKEV